MHSNKLNDRIIEEMDLQFSLLQNGLLYSRDFSDAIQRISPLFCQIYGEARAAEKGHLTQICGVGYGKALEFLIKDYAKLENPGLEQKIEKALLSECIQKYVGDDLRKDAAMLAAKLRNDETHYVRKHTDKDVKDLKNLIELTLALIEEAERRKVRAADIEKLKREMIKP